MQKEQESFFSRKELFWSLALTLFFAVSMNMDWRGVRILWYGTLLLTLVFYLVVYNGRIYLTNLKYMYWFLSFVALSVVSLLWSLSVDSGLVVIKDFVVIGVVLFLIQFSLNYGYRVESLLGCFFVATIVNSVYIVLAVDLAELGEVQLGAKMISGWNGNDIGFMTVQGVLIGVFLCQNTKNHLLKCVCALLSIALAFLTIYTGSRTAFIVMFFGLILYLWLNSPKKVIRNFFVLLVAFIFVSYLIMNVEAFYNVLGSRFEGLFSFFSGTGEIDNSANIRKIFIENGKQWFWERPILGYGINNYQVINESVTGHYTYAHNTFIELAVNLGIVGLIWYYSMYGYLAVRLSKRIKCSPLFVFLLASLLSSLISHYGTVCYYNFYQNFLLFLSFFTITSKEQGISNSRKSGIIGGP